MRKSLLSVLFLMLCVVCAVANPVTPEQAQQKAKAFLAKRGMAASATLDLAYQGKQQAHQNGAPAKNACYYVFNNGHNAGFVIVAGDDCAEDVLGYATNGSFDADNIPENMQAFLQGYAEEIAALRAMGANTANSGDETVEVARKVVAPLIETHWNQHDPYNQKCANPQGQKCVTGCVATALAQVMYYYKWPDSSTSTNTIPGYTLEDWRTHAGDTYGALDPTKFDWAKMKNAYVNTGADDEKAEIAVANLMLYCGRAVLMDYGVNESGGLESEIPNALKNYFGYPGNPSWELRSQYTSTEWDELIYNELKNSRPVLYGANTAGGSGHEFICDGYDGHGLYHINWGWGGVSDGYFRLQALRPSTQGTGGSSDYGGYSLGHDAIIGVCNTEIESNNNNDPNDDPEEAGSVLSTVDLQVTGSTTVDYNPNYSWGLGEPSAKFSYTMSGDETEVEYCFAVYQGDELVSKGEVTSKSMSEGAIYTSSGNLFWGLGTDTETGLSDGTYQIKVINRAKGTEEWFLNDNSDLIYVEVEIANGKATFTNVKIDPPTPPEPVKSIEVTNIEQRFDIAADLTQIRAYVRNTGEVDYSSSLALYLDDVNMAEEGVYLPVDGEDYVDFFFSTITGSVDLEIKDANGSVLYTKNGFVLSEGSQQESSLTMVKVKMKNFSDDKYNMYGSLLDGTVTLRNDGSTDFEGNLTLNVYVVSKVDEEGNPQSYSPKKQLIPFSIKAGEETDISVTYSAMTVGDQFQYELIDPSGELLDYNFFWNYTKIVPGVVYWKGNGERFAVAPAAEMTIPDDAVAISLEDLGADLSNYSITIPTAKYPIVYVAQGAETPAAWDNVVKGGTATQISLDDDYDFFVPKRFFAKEVRYSCLPEVGADGRGGWQTITLPFTVEKVTSGNKVVDWYHGNDTEEKDFWVREFKKVVGNTVKFADAEVWVPNVPYIFAVPGDHWGPQYDLTNKEMDFSATNVWVEKSTVSAVVSDNYEFIGISGGMTPGTGGYDETAERMENAYVLNEKGTAFVSGSSTWQKKHNLCYFTIRDRTIDPPARLNIGTFDETDGICMPQVTATDGQQVDVYTIDGMKVATVTVNGGMVDLGRLPKGVYIVEGKKIVR